MTIRKEPDARADGERPTGERIAKLLARAGVASRREVERMIEDGRVALDGAVLDTPATILPSLRGVSVDGKPVDAPEAARLFLYHKPTGLLVTERDPGGRTTIYDRLPTDLPRVVPVGRLDLNTEGLLLLTTDGGLKRQLELPATGVERSYRARAYGPVTQAQLEDLIEGIEIEGIRYGSIDANLERRTSTNVWIEMTLTEGKNREVRRVLEHLGLQVSRLIRTRYGPFVLGDLAPGQLGEVKQHDLVAFRKTLDGPRRPRGSEPEAIVEVEARPQPRVAAPAPTRAPRPEPARDPVRPPARPSAPPRAAPAAKSGGGWGTRVRASRPVEASAMEARPRRGTFRAEERKPDPRVEPEERWETRPPRPVAPARAPAERSDRSAHPRPATTGHPYARKEGTRPAPPAGSTRVRADGSAAAGDKRARSTVPAAKPPRPGKTPFGAKGPSASKGPSTGKGPSGGQGHPPRTPKGKR